MGLDSVHLIMAMEDYFQVQIPDREAEKMATMGEVAGYISKRLGVDGVAPADGLQVRLQERLADAILAVTGLRPSHMDVDAYGLIGSGDRVRWERVAEVLGLPMPLEVIVNPPQVRQRWWHKLVDRMSPPERLPLARLCEWVAVHNYKVLLQAPKLQDAWECWIAVAGVTVDSLGVELWDVAPGASFANDLGVD